MAKVVIIHDVADVEAWLQYKSERAEAIATLGGTNVVDHAALDGAKTVAISADIPDVDAMVAALSAPPPELAEIMGRHGVIPPLTTYVEA